MLNSDLSFWHIPSHNFSRSVCGHKHMLFKKTCTNNKKHEIWGVFYIMIAAGHTCFDALYAFYIGSLVVESTKIASVPYGKIAVVLTREKE